MNADPQPPTQNSWRAIWRELMGPRELAMLGALGVMLLFISFGPVHTSDGWVWGGARETFWSVTNQQSLGRQIALLGILALGQTFVIIAGGFDLSVGAIVGISGVMTAFLLTSDSTAGGLAGWGLPAWQALPIVLMLAALIGCCNGLLVTKLGISPFVATLSMMLVLRGLAKIVTRAIAIPVQDPSVVSLAAIQGGQIPPIVILLAVTLLLSVLFLHFTTTGRYLYAIGSNEEATRLSGVNVQRVKILAYTMSGLVAGLVGILHASYNYQGEPNAGRGYELFAIASVVIGGAALTGGEGTAVGAIIGASIFQVVLNGLPKIIKVDSSIWEDAIVGMVLLAAVVIASVRQMRRRR